MFREAALPSRQGLADGALLVLDIDGVLIDAQRSFHEAVARALRDLAPGLPWGDHYFQAFKRLGGYNNDFRLAAAALAVEEAGAGGDGWWPDPGRLASLEDRIQDLEPRAQAQVQRHYAQTKSMERPTVGRMDLLEVPAQLAILTGRPPEELDLAFEVLGFALPAVSDSAPRFRKPEPAGLLLLAERFGAKRVVFVGDTPDDAACLRAARQAQPGLSWTFAGVGPDRTRFLTPGDLQAEDLPQLLPILKDFRFWSDDR